MANQLKMAEIQAILALVGHGWSYRRISRELGVDRSTVRRYVRLAATDGAKPDPQAGTPALTGSDAPIGAAAESKPAMALTGSDGDSEAAAGPKPAMALTGFSEPIGCRIHLSAAWPWREAILQKLDQGLCAQRIYQDLGSPEHGYAGSYHSVRRLVQKLSTRHEMPVRRMECDPGEEAQVDFGKGAPILGADGRRKTSWVFRIVLSHSRKGYSEAIFHQTTDEFLRCLENAFAHFGGLARTLVIDNLRAAVSRADWFDPELCPKVRSFAEHYGIAILPTKPYTPRHKDHAPCCTSWVGIETTAVNRRRSVNFRPWLLVGASSSIDSYRYSCLSLYGQARTKPAARHRLTVCIHTPRRRAISSSVRMPASRLG